MALTSTPCSLSLVFRFISLHPISSPPLHYNYYFPHVGPRPQRLVSISFLHRGLRRWWDTWGCWVFPEHMGRPRITARLKWTYRFQNPTSSHLSSIMSHIHYSFFWPAGQNIGSVHGFSCALSPHYFIVANISILNTSVFRYHMYLIPQGIRVVCIRLWDVILRYFAWICDWNKKRSKQHVEFQEGADKHRDIEMLRCRRRQSHFNIPDTMIYWQSQCFFFRDINVWNIGCTPTTSSIKDLTARYFPRAN